METDFILKEMENYILYRESITGYFQHIIKKDGNSLIKNKIYVN